MQLSIKHCSILAGIGLCLAAVSSLAENATAQGFSEMFSKGKVGVDFRYRYEYVNEHGIDDEAKASTLRLLPPDTY